MTLPSRPSKTSIMHCSLLFIAILFAPSFTLAAPTSSLRGNKTDRLALLAIKAQITDDPLGLMSSWNDSVHFCNWKCVICGQLHQRVITLNLSYHELVGSLSPHIGNLTFLRGTSLEKTYFQGELPPELGYLLRLKYLNFSNNSFLGELWPISLATLALLCFG